MLMIREALVVWVAGRLAVTFSAAIGPLAAALIDASFLFLIAAAVALAFSVTALLLWIVFPFGTATGVALFAAGALQAICLTRWAGDRTLRDRLVLVLHIAYAFVPLGFLLSAGAALGVLLPSAGLHAWMARAAGMMPLAVMTRASLGHTGRTLIASVGTQTIYTAVFVAAIARIAAALLPGWSNPLLHLASFAWIVAFCGFALIYGPILLAPRLISGTSVRETH